MRPGALDLVLTGGADFVRTFTWKVQDAATGQLVPRDLSVPGWKARSQIRQGGRLVVTLDSDPDSADRDGTITLDAGGNLHLSCPWAAFRLRAGRCQWSLEVEGPGYPRDVLLEGTATITAEVTR